MKAEILKTKNKTVLQELDEDRDSWASRPWPNCKPLQIVSQDISSLKKPEKSTVTVTNFYTINGTI